MLNAKCREMGAIDRAFTIFTIDRETELKHPAASKLRGINCALQSAGFQPAFVPRSGELNPQRLNRVPNGVLDIDLRQ